MTEPLLQADHLRIRAPATRLPILEDVSLTVRRGERVALVGPSGAGKTSLLRALNGSFPIESGRIRFNGLELDHGSARRLRQLRRAMAVIPQQHDLVPGLRVSHNVMAGALGRWSNWRALRFLFWQRAAELNEARSALALVGLPDRLRERTATLSGGQQQRVAIARALVQRPLLILADEPVASLDPTLARQILDLLCGLAEDQGVALLCTLHQPELAREYFPRSLELRRGQLQETAAPSRLAEELGAQRAASARSWH